MELIVNGRTLDLCNTQIMGILNVTPDSFFDGGIYSTVDKSIDYVHNMITHGATLIDIGGESTRPGSTKISDEEELERLLPVTREIANRFDVFISVNTSSALVIRELSTIGIHLINDVRSLSMPHAMSAAKQSNLAICLTHNIHCNFNTSKCIQSCFTYSNIVYEVDNYFNEIIKICNAEGISRNRLLIDPGFGFKKQLLHNYQLLSNLKYFCHFNLPILVGISRKSMINYNNKYPDPKYRLIGSTTCAAIAAMQGVHIIRVHDVKETMDALHIIKAMQHCDRSKEW